MAPFGDLMSGHLDVLGEKLLAYSTGNPFMLLSRATRDAVPRGTIDASLPGKLDAALARNDETAARRLAGEAMRRVARNFRTLNDRLAARGYPVRRACPYSRREYARAVDDYDALVANYQHHIPLMLEEFWKWVGGCSLLSFKKHSCKHRRWWEREHPDILEVNDRAAWVHPYFSLSSTVRDRVRDLPADELHQAYVMERWPDEHYTDPLHLYHVADLMKTDPPTGPVIHIAPDYVHKDGYSGGPPYEILCGRDAGLDPFISDGIVRHLSHSEFHLEFTASAIGRKEDPMRPDINEVLTRTWLSENPGLTAEEIKKNLNQYCYDRGEWLKSYPGPGDRGPLTLLEYLRLALLVHGGFTGLDAANPNFDPLRRALIADLEPF